MTENERAAGDASEDAYDAAIKAANSAYTAYTAAHDGAAYDAAIKAANSAYAAASASAKEYTPLSYVSLHLTCPVDGPAATVSIYDQWLAGSKPKVLIQGRPGDGSFVEFVGDADTVASLREAADVVELLIERGVESA